MSRKGRTRGRQISLGSALVRRGWILVLSAVAVAALAYGVAHLRSATYTAQAVLDVPPALGPSTPGDPSGAAALAKSYVGVLPQDEALKHYIRAHGGGHGTLHASFAGGGKSTLTIRYSASSRRDATEGAAAAASGLSGSQPVTPNVASNTLQVVRTPRGAHRTIVGWTASAVLSTPAGAGPAQVSADEANKLAASYAGLIAEDNAVLSALTKATGRTMSQVKSDLTAVNDQNTSIVRLTYKDSSARRAALAARTAAYAVSGSNPQAKGILRSSLEVVSLPRTPAASSPTKNANTAVPIGAAIGLALGLVLLIAWERSDPHITRPRELSGQLGCPATPLDRLSPDAARALLERWTTLTDHSPARVAIVPASPRMEGAAEDAVDLLLSVGGERVAYDHDRHGSGNGAGQMNGQGRHSVLLVQTAAPGDTGGGEAVALESDLTVLVIPKGMKAADLAVLDDRLGDFGVDPAWALLAGRRRVAMPEPTEFAPDVGEPVA